MTVSKTLSTKDLEALRTAARKMAAQQSRTKAPKPKSADAYYYVR
ncbi:MAG: hypothetical protein AB7J32_16385 [Pseudonocardia sp.]